MESEKEQGEEKREIIKVGDRFIEESLFVSSQVLMSSGNAPSPQGRLKGTWVLFLALRMEAPLCRDPCIHYLGTGGRLPR